MYFYCIYIGRCLSAAVQCLEAPDIGIEDALIYHFCLFTKCFYMECSSIVQEAVGSTLI